MTAMELEAKKAHIIRLIFKMEDEEVLTKVENLLSRNTLTAEEETCSLSPEVLREAVLQSEDDIRKGKVHTIEEMKNIHPRL